MTTELLLQQWIVDALTTAGHQADDLQVARHVWANHEQEIRGTGDLVLTWQLDLRAAAQSMLATGSLTHAEDRWLLAGADTVVRARAGWELDEIDLMARAYVSMLRDEHEGRRARKAEVVAEIVARTGRDAKTLERIWSNITHVVQDLGYQPLGFWPPRSNVPTGVRAAVEQALAT